MDQQKIVEDFGREEAPVRLLLASDVASEGINLHFLCHKMIHFDIPWSFMCFQQRNGRIDRYGQEREPRIVYLMTESVSEKIKGDNRILELLITKDEQAVKNIGEPSPVRSRTTPSPAAPANAPSPTRPPSTAAIAKPTMPPPGQPLRNRG